MQAFKQGITKPAFLAEIKKHRELDQIVQGTYGEENGTWRGCAVGCSVHSINILKNKDYQTSDHSVYESELGIPSELAYLEDTLFEELPVKAAKLWPERFTKAIKPGSDLSLVTAHFMVWQFEDKKYGIKNIKEVQEDKEIYGFCEEVVVLYKRKLAGDTPSEKDFYDLYIKIDRAWPGARAWAWAWAWAGAWAGAGAWARAGARSWARSWAWARAWAWAWARADYDKAYAEYIKAGANKLIELLAEAPIRNG